MLLCWDKAGMVFVLWFAWNRGEAGKERTILEKGGGPEWPVSESAFSLYLFMISSKCIFRLNHREVELTAQGSRVCEPC